MEPEATFSEHKQYLFSLAYRMTGSAADAEDLVQETYLRWQQADRTDIKVPRAFLTTVITRLAMNHLESARVRREEYFGTWLPEPLLTAEPDDHAELSQSLTMAFLVMLESLAPVERAVFLLHEVFDYSHAETAAITGKTEEACRQILSRAKRSIRQRPERFHVDADRAAQLTNKLFEATQSGNINALMSMLDENVVLHSDGGGRTRAAVNPIYGADRVARFLIGIVRKGLDLQRRGAEINAQPGLLSFRDGALHGAFVLDIEHERVRTVFIVVNPDKLQHLSKEKQNDNTRNATAS